MKTILYTWFAVLLFGMAAVSCGDDDTKNNDTTGITGSSWKASETVGADRTTKKYTFKASANWVAQSDKPEWCKILTSSGDKGSDRQLNITVEANETGSTRSANITVQVSGYARAAQFAITQLGSSSGGTGADTELNKQVDKILEYYYLWNGEYRQMSRDLSLDYISSSDNFLKRTLLEMTTNDLDKKRQSNGSYSVYSYLLRTPLTKAVDGTKPEVNHGVAKKKEYGFGIAGLMGVRFVDGNNQPTGEYGLVVTSVYPDSPASEAGFRRGTFFAQYNGAAITAANLNSVYGTLIAPGGASTVKLTENKQGAQPVSLTAREIYPNPVIHSEVITSGAHRIGYLVYDSFDAAYDDELLAAVKKLKDGNITDMVLDLRNKEMTLISISRDAMCTLDILDSAGEHVGTATAQLALAYAYGDGAERSCELTSAAVSRLFYDLPIPVYGSIYMQGIRQLVDSVGGVTVTPDTSIPGFAAGQPVTLTGQLTESYIRYRADSTEGNNQRMQRQKQVVLALVHKMLAQVKEDPASILALYNNVRRNTTTNINTAMMVYLAQQASGMHFSDDIVNVPGTSVMGEQRHAEYQVDSDALLELILSIFYEPVEG